MNREAIAQFYDSFADYQMASKINIRHRSIFSLLKRFGLNRNATVLEIGCGIGTVTSLIARYVKKGKIVAVDISPQSIEIAKNLICKKLTNIDFIVSDMKDFSCSVPAFDFIVLPDVLEHIPIKQHENLFKTLSIYTHKDTKMLIHIPSPFCLRWFIENKPDILQIIDQPLDSNHIVNVAYHHNFHLICMNTYSLTIKGGDYQYYVFGVGSQMKMDKVEYYSYYNQVWNEIRSRLRYLFIDRLF